MPEGLVMMATPAAGTFDTSTAGRIGASGEAVTEATSDSTTRTANSVGADLTQHPQCSFTVLLDPGEHLIGVHARLAGHLRSDIPDCPAQSTRPSLNTPECRRLRRNAPGF
ncbi:hypothetical protein [Achromobacter sp. 2789STDY5608615]|uniref:hypothetical protein n=1 Tax=Achromobacter sp. 2789STDY5608615 TaxID=1806492 RepID=UPI0012E19239|nr:hypothetical protein [Achromobacter sp. 2789STDY5608615]